MHFTHPQKLGCWHSIRPDQGCINWQCHKISLTFITVLYLNNPPAEVSTYWEFGKKPVSNITNGNRRLTGIVDSFLIHYLVLGKIIIKYNRCYYFFIIIPSNTTNFSFNYLKWRNKISKLSPFFGIHYM